MNYQPFTLAQLAEGINRTAVTAGNPKLVNKWEATGLLSGLSKLGMEKMSRLLENQAAEILRNSSMLLEANALSLGGAGLGSSGQVAGFTNVAFPIVRRVFAGLISNELVSVQPMSLPSGLLFYLDYTYGSNVGGDAGLLLDNNSANELYSRGQSVYGNPAGAAVRSGALAAGGQYGLLNTGYSKVHKEAMNLVVNTDSVGYWLSGSTWTTGATATVKTKADFVGFNARFVHHDPVIDVAVDNSELDYCFAIMSASEITGKINGADLNSLEQNDTSQTNF
jgi:hypothetical protein